MGGQRTQCPCLVCAYDLDGVSIFRQRRERQRGRRRRTHGCCCRRVLVVWWMVISTGAVAVDGCCTTRDCCFSPTSEALKIYRTLNDLRNDGRF